MKKIIYLLLTICVLFLGAGKAESADIDPQLYSIAMDLITKLDDFFFNLHTASEDFSPVPDDRRGAVRSNFFPLSFPLTWMNLNPKVKVMGEKAFLPQVDLVGTYGNWMALSLAKSFMSSDDGDEITASFQAYSIGAVLSKKANESTKIFGGIKYSKFNMKLDITSLLESDDSSEEESWEGITNSAANRLSSLKMNDIFFFTGIMHAKGNGKAVVAQAGYGFKNKKVFGRIIASKKHLELGMDIYPESFLVIQPFMAYHWYF